MKKLLIFPANGNGIEALDCLVKAYDLVGFIDDDPLKQKEGFCGYPVFSREALRKFPRAFVLAVPGSPDTFLERSKIIESLSIPYERFARVIHPKASVSSLSKIGSNVLILAGAVVTSNAVIEDHVCLLSNSVVHHDAFIGAFTLVGSQVTIAGRSRIGASCYIGSGSTIIQDVRIGAFSLVGAASNVIDSFPARAKIVGNPARQIGENA